MFRLCASVVLLLSCHRYCHVYWHPYVSSVRSHRKSRSLSSLKYRTAQMFTHRHSRCDAPRRDVVRKTQSLMYMRFWIISSDLKHASFLKIRGKKTTLQQRGCEFLLRGAPCRKHRRVANGWCEGLVSSESWVLYDTLPMTGNIIYSDS